MDEVMATFGDGCPLSSVEFLGRLDEERWKSYKNREVKIAITAGARDAKPQFINRHIL
jgi:hypothetical protein